MRNSTCSPVMGILLMLTSSFGFAENARRGDLSPIDNEEWDAAHVSHLLERAGFGGTSTDIRTLSNLDPAAAVRRLVYFEGAPAPNLPPFDHSGIFDEGLDPFLPSRPATTQMAKATGEALGVRVKPSGNRPIQPVVNKFFYWLRASRLETDRVAYWWANRMLTSPRPLQEKMALFWHGHFATNEDKVRDYRKGLKQLELFQKEGLGNFRTLLIAVAQDPAMLAFLDAGVNVKGSPNENFAREIMELFTMGVGNYTEEDIREAARAFTGWNFSGLEFHISPEQHDNSEKTFLGRRGQFDGVDIINLILEQPVTAEYIAGKLYRYFVRQDLGGELQARLGAGFKSLDYDIAAFLEMLFLAKDFYAPASVGTRIKGPVELVVSTYRKAGLEQIPGVPDFNVTTGALGQRLMHPPTVAGWSHGKSWITPSLLFERGNFVLDMVFPDIAFVPPDRYPGYGGQIVTVHKRLRQGMDISSATKPAGVSESSDMMAASNLLADRDEAFNTRYGSYRGWQMAIERVKPISRHTARLDLTAQVLEAELKTPREVVGYFVNRFFSVPLDAETLLTLAAFFEAELGTEDVESAASYLEEPLRMLLHLILSRPEYQLG
ncbi:MAG: DUF1800 domain-containing protein [Gammaproteobacteria bacterium]|nr:DUF1800 domain-containing protein [Gammaproteobacteria bacterium]